MLSQPVQAAEKTLLPLHLKESLKKAYDSNDSYVIDAVTLVATKHYPQHELKIEQYVRYLKSNNAQTEIATTKNAEKKEEAPKAEEKEKVWSGNIEFGADYSTGNTEEENIKGEATLNYEKDKWKNTLEVKADSGKENDTRTSEEYRVENQTKYLLEEHNYVFGELGYVNDRFSGYEYRISELLGYGHHFIKEDDMTLSGEAGVGSRQSQLEGQEEEVSALAKVKAIYDWKINDGLHFHQDLSYSIASDAGITESETSLKSSITDTLYLKLGFSVEHISDVPPNTENTDTQTSITAGYDF